MSQVYSMSVHQPLDDLAFQGFYSEAASHNRRCSQPHHATPKLSPDTRVIIITAREERALRALALERGAIAFLVKPFDDEVFLAPVRRALPGIAT